MGWPYQFLELSAAEQHESRELLDRYALYAEISSICPVAFLAALRLMRLVLRRVTVQGTIYDAVSTDTSSNGKSLTQTSWTQMAPASLRQIAWWLGGDIELGNLNLGRKDEALYGIAWATWLLFLCVIETGNDYIHLTRRFAAICVSQFPIQYLMSLRYFNPVAFAFQTTHKRVNRWHQVLGWIIYTFGALHSAFYCNYFVQVGEPLHIVCHLVPATGLLAVLVTTLLCSTALPIIRQYSYRLFYITHLFSAIAAPLIVWFHVHHGRIFMGQALFFFLGDLMARNICTFSGDADCEILPGTNLLKVVVAISSTKFNQFARNPASYTYLSIPRSSLPAAFSLSALRFAFISNPFTVAAVNGETQTITFVARELSGPLTRTLTRLSSLHSSECKASLIMSGPFHAPNVLGNLADRQFERVLLVAGGVGATFILPLYEHLLVENSTAQVKLVWAARSSDEMDWATCLKGMGACDAGEVDLYVTGDKREASGMDGHALNDVELNRLEPGGKLNPSVSIATRNRPNLREIVDDVFEQEDTRRVAVIVCGPLQMSCDLRRAVGFWVKEGRDVWFHTESYEN